MSSRMDERLRIAPGNPLRGRVRLPGDKSMAHRAALLAALAEGVSRIRNFLDAGVTRVMLEALSALGVTWELEEGILIVRGRGIEGLRSPFKPIHCGNSATTMRLLAGMLACAGLPAVLDGSVGLQKRPMERIVTPLQRMGVAIQATDGHAPLILRKGEVPLRALDYTLPIASAQVKSCLLLAALAGDGPSTLYEPGPSRDHTERMLRSLGVSVQWGQIDRNGEQIYYTRLDPCAQQPGLMASSTTKPVHFTKGFTGFELKLPGDFSAAAFLIVAALITPGSELVIENVGLNPRRTGLLDALQSMGAELEVFNTCEQYGEPIGDLSVRYSTLHGARVGGPLVVRMIDEFPAFAVAAAHAHGDTVVLDAGELRHKESDRIHSLCVQFSHLGVDMMETAEGFVVRGGKTIHGGEASSEGDHRLAMALTVAGLASRKPVIVHGAEVVGESFPNFPEILQGLGADIVVERLE